MNWPNSRSAILQALGRPLAKITPGFASFRYGDGRVGDVHRAAVIPIAIVGHAGHFMAYVVDADVPALLRKNALETPGGHLNFCERVLALESLEPDVPLEMSAAGHYLLNVADFPESNSVGKPNRRNKGCAKRAVNDNGVVRNDALSSLDVSPRPKMRLAGKSGPSLILSCLDMKQFEPDGLRPGGEILPSLQLDGPPLESTKETSLSPTQRASTAEPAGRRIAFPIHNARTSTALGDALDGEKIDPEEIIRRFHGNWAHASAQQLKRTTAEADWRANWLIPLAGDVVRECDICRAPDVAPAIPVVGTSPVSSFNERVQVDISFLGDLITLRVLDLFSRYPLLVPARSKNPDEVWGTFCFSWIAVFGEPRIVQSDEGGEWKNDIWVDLRADRYIKVQYQGAGAHLWNLGRRNGLARGIHRRIPADGRYAARQLIPGVEFCLNAMLSTNGFSAYQLAFGGIPADNFGWGDGDEDLLSAQDA